MATYVIVHGAGDSGSNWELVATELRERDHDVVAPDLPADDESAGLSDYVDTVVEAIGDRTDLIVVAHSLGGFTAPLVCARVPVALLVLVAAMVPSPGEKAGEWWTNTGHARRSTRAGTTTRSGCSFMTRRPSWQPRRSRTGRDQAATPMLEPWPLDAWPDVTTRYLLCRDDRFLPAEWTRRMVRERLGVEADEIDGAHMPYVSRPRALAERLEEYRIQTKGETWVSR